MTTLAQHKTRSASKIQAVYERRIHPRVATEANHGKFVAFDPETCEFELGETGRSAVRRLAERIPGVQPIAIRIGYDLLVDASGRPHYVGR